jgi:ribulose bisphosphate carboxylase small subunit
VNIEFTDDPHPRNTYWEMWGQPMFDLQDPIAVLYELNECLTWVRGQGAYFTVRGRVKSLI